MSSPSTHALREELTPDQVEQARLREEEVPEPPSATISVPPSSQSVDPPETLFRSTVDKSGHLVVDDPKRPLGQPEHHEGLRKQVDRVAQQWDKLKKQLRKDKSKFNRYYNEIRANSEPFEFIGENSNKVKARLKNISKSTISGTIKISSPASYTLQVGGRVAQSFSLRPGRKLTVKVKKIEPRLFDKLTVKYNVGGSPKRSAHIIVSVQNCLPDQ